MRSWIDETAADISRFTACLAGGLLSAWFLGLELRGGPFDDCGIPLCERRHVHHLRLPSPVSSLQVAHSPQAGQGTRARVLRMVNCDAGTMPALWNNTVVVAGYGQWKVARAMR